jgi:hypothetical protein
VAAQNSYVIPDHGTWPDWLCLRDGWGEPLPLVGSTPTTSGNLLSLLTLYFKRRKDARCICCTAKGLRVFPLHLGLLHGPADTRTLADLDFRA